MGLLSWILKELRRVWLRADAHLSSRIFLTGDSSAYKMRRCEPTRPVAMSPRPQGVSSAEAAFSHGFYGHAECHAANRIMLADQLRE